MPNIMAFAMVAEAIATDTNVATSAELIDRVPTGEVVESMKDGR